MAEERNSFASVQDITTLYRSLTEEEEARASELLPVVSDRLRVEAAKVGKNLDDMILTDEALANVARSVTVDIVARILMTPTASTGFGPMSQMSQAAGGYSVSGTFLNPGGGLFIKNSELAALGLKRQRYGVMEIYADPRNPDNPL